MEEKIVIVLNEMSEYLSITQMKKLQEVIIKTFADNEASKVEISNEEFLKMFLDAKRIEGCSERTIIYYQATVKHLLSQITTEVRKITTEEIREYLSKYQKWNNADRFFRIEIRLLFRLREEIRSWQMYLIAWDIWSERVVDLERLSVDMNFRLIIMKRKDRLFGQTDISLRW